ncbi:MAG: PilT/PilU family type 4a pilus ATPase, partial [Myxococcales bacterium]|nr:PilT/PilU family type 4a pilus ATPase [Myxococcales bacterium]
DLLLSMAPWNASDLFLGADRAPALRIAGIVQQLELPATSGEELERFLHLILAPAQHERLEADGDLDVGYSLDQRTRFRLNIHRQKGALAIVARALPSGALEFAELRLPDYFAELVDRPRGLILVTGATGSGKSTTLAAMVHWINRHRRAHIVTIEDPIEFVHADILSRVTQREVGSDTRSFHTALRHVVRESPDVILIGEMRDAESIRVAISAALTGHLVLSTLHTVSATQTLQRIMGYYLEHEKSQVALDLSMCLAGVIGQRLVVGVDGASRLPALEILTNTPGTARLIREQRIEELYDLLKAGGAPQMQTYNQALLRLYRDEAIGYETGVAYASNVDEFRLSAQGLETGVDAWRGLEELAKIEEVDLRSLLALCVRHGASDLHLSVGRPPIFRISGVLHRLPIPALGAGHMRSLLFSILTSRQRSEFELEKEIDFSLAIEGGARFRVNAYNQRGSLAMALRAIPSAIPDAETLGLPETLFRLVERPQGLLLVVGPTGSGKTTTLACLVDYINRTRTCHIITIEDPIEYNHESVHSTIDQREVYADTKSFARALKYILRQDPDVILIGEMRDLETISAALTAAETGHLVMATLHTNDAAQTIDRVVDVFPPHQQQQIRTQLSTSLLGVVSQRLLPRADGKGRVAAFELMLGTPAIRNIIREGKTHQIRSIIETSARDGMVALDKALEQLVASGSIEQDEALRFATTPNALRR